MPISPLCALVIKVITGFLGSLLELRSAAAWVSTLFKGHLASPDVFQPTKAY